MKDSCDVNKNMLVFAEFSPADREQNLQDPSVRLWRVTGPDVNLQTSVVNLDHQTQSKSTETTHSVFAGNVLL